MFVGEWVELHWFAAMVVHDPLLQQTVSVPLETVYGFVLLL